MTTLSRCDRRFHALVQRAPLRNGFGAYGLEGIGRWGRRFCGAADNAEADVFRRWRATRICRRRTIRAATDHFAFTVAGQHPLSNVAAEIVDRLFAVLALSTEAADFFQQRCCAF